MGWSDKAQSIVESWGNVRITVDLDDDLLTAVEERRTACKTTGQVLADLARQALRTSPAAERTPAPAADGGVLADGEDRLPTLARA
jgi:Arc/MetJ family transcription regulator